MSWRGITRRLVAFGCLFAAFGALAAFPLVGGASAATRYASPDGTGQPAAGCPSTDPCSLADAVAAPAVNPGDQIVVGTGAYLLTSGIDVTKAISVGGSPSAVPTIVASTPGEPAIGIDATNAELHDVTLVQIANDRALSVARGTVDRVTAESDGSAACELGATGGGQSLIRDSVCRSGESASGAAAVQIAQSAAGTRAGALRNVTAFAAGSGSTGIDVNASGGGTTSLDVLNVIASGVGRDVRATAASTSTAIVALTTSNFTAPVITGAGTATVTPTASNGNQTAEPLLANPNAGDFEEIKGSPTIDAGSTGTLLGDRDLAGEPRIQGPAPDIGADERDGTVPRTTIESGPAAAIKTGKATFTFISNEPGSTFKCQLDDEDFAPCSSPHTTDTLDQGEHIFRVRATDPAGNVEGTPAERTFVVDKIVAGANVAAKRTQRAAGRKVSLAVTVKAGELARVRAAGDVHAGKKRFRFESKQVTLIAGQKRRLTLTPKDKRASRKILKAIKQGKDVEAVLTATFIDILGNNATSGDVDVRLKLGRGK